MASGALGLDPSATATSPGPSPSRRRTMEAAMSPAVQRYNPVEGTSPAECDRVMREVTEDHARRLERLAVSITILSTKSTTHDSRMQEIVDNDTDLKERLKALESQILTANQIIERNDNELKEKLKVLEGNIEASLAQLVEGRFGTSLPSHGSEELTKKVADLDVRSDMAFKSLEAMIQMTRSEIDGKHTEMEQRVHSRILEVQQYVEHATRHAQGQQFQGPAAGHPQAREWHSPSEPARQTHEWHPSGQAAAPAGRFGTEPDFPRFSAADVSQATYHHMGGGNTSEKKSLFDDKVAIPPVGRYSESGKI